VPGGTVLMPMATASSSPGRLAEDRARRWWGTRRRVGSIERAAAFIQDVGFALLFPARGVELPSLLAVVADRPVEEVEWGPESELVWGWKDELPRRGLAWYGRFLRGRPSLLAPSLLADLYPRSGRPDDFLRQAGLSSEARRIAEVVLVSGPSSTATLRVELGVAGKRDQARFGQALTELGRAMVITHFGTEARETGWPAAVLELTARVFPVGGPRRERDAARLRAATRFLDTMVSAQARELAGAFGWSMAESKRALEALAADRPAG